MLDDEKQLKWCLKQSRGAKLTSPSNNLCNAYLEKCKSSVKSMEVNSKADIPDWTISTSYYSKYFAVYALFSKIGIKCEIHDCTIMLFKYLFDDSLPNALFDELRSSKEDRIEMQYYTKGAKINMEGVINQTKNFVLEIEKLIDQLNTEKVGKLRLKFEKVIET